MVGAATIRPTRAERYLASILLYPPPVRSSPSRLSLTNHQNDKPYLYDRNSPYNILPTQTWGLLLHATSTTTFLFSYLSLVASDFRRSHSCRHRPRCPLPLLQRTPQRRVLHQGHKLPDRTAIDIEENALVPCSSVVRSNRHRADVRVITIGRGHPLGDGARVHGQAGGAAAAGAFAFRSREF